MSLQALTYLVVGASFALYIGIAIWSKAQSTGDFRLAWLSKSSYVDAFIYGSWAAVLLLERLLRVRRGRLAGLKTSL